MILSFETPPCPRMYTLDFRQSVTSSLFEASRGEAWQRSPCCISAVERLLPRGERSDRILGEKAPRKVEINPTH